MANGPSSYLQHLPESFRAPPAPGAAPFLDRYLKIFEALLTGRDDAKISGLEEILDRFVDALDPGFTPVEILPAADASPKDASLADGGRIDSAFLTYLASWLALTLDRNWGLAKRRIWVKQIATLYQRRGTRAALNAYLAMFVGSQVKVDETREFVLGKENVKQGSTLGVNTYAGDPPRHFFRVRINHGFPEAIARKARIPAEPFDIVAWTNLRKGARAVVDLEKPAHTHYTLDARTPGIILGPQSSLGRATVGVDTLIWQSSNPI